MRHLGKKAREARVAETLKKRYPTWTPHGVRFRKEPSPFVIVHDPERWKCVTIHRLDCEEVRKLAGRSLRFMYARTFTDVHVATQSERRMTTHFCTPVPLDENHRDVHKPIPTDAYYQCLVCGDYIHAHPERYNATCRCGGLTVDPMAPIGPESPTTITGTPGHFRTIGFPEPEK